MKDLLQGIFSVLTHLPVSAVGINPSVHYRVESIDYWHKIGHTLAPKSIWNELFQAPGMQTLAIKANREGEFPGVTNVFVEPSAKYAPGIFVRTNSHHDIPITMLHTEASAEALKFLLNEWEPATMLARKVADKIFERIRPE